MEESRQKPGSSGDSESKPLWHRRDARWHTVGIRKSCAIYSADSAKLDMPSRAGCFGLEDAQHGEYHEDDRTAKPEARSTGDFVHQVDRHHHEADHRTDLSQLLAVCIAGKADPCDAGNRTQVYKGGEPPYLQWYVKRKHLHSNLWKYSSNSFRGGQVLLKSASSHQRNPAFHSTKKGTSRTTRSAP